MQVKCEMSSITTSEQNEFVGSTNKALLDECELEMEKGSMIESMQENSMVSDEYIATEDEKSVSSVDKDPKTLNEVLHEFIPQIKISFEKWSDTFRECDAIENLYPRRLDEMLKEAHCLEQQLKLQKDTLKNRLKILTRTLASNPQKDE